MSKICEICGGNLPPINMRFCSRSCNGKWHMRERGCAMRMLQKGKVRGPYRKKRTVAERFYALVIPEPNSGCHLWYGTCDSNGYGLLHADGRRVRATRLAMRLAGIDVPDHLDVCHKCDNPACVNVDHLFLGTASDNIRDMFRKGRGHHNVKLGSENHLSRLTEEQVREIKTSQLSSVSLARMYGVDKSNIWNIRTGRTWRHLFVGEPETT